MRINLKLLFIAVIFQSSAAQAALYDRGGGLLYDDVLNLTWLQDADYAKTSGYDADGRMDWYHANLWADTLVYHDALRGVDYQDWRLPKANPVGITYNGKFSFDGTTDESYNLTSPNSELAYMFYVNLGLKGYYSSTGEVQSDFGAVGNGGFGSADVGLVKNIRAGVYWTGSVYKSHPTLNAWMFDTYWGNQNFYNQWDQLSTWAVREGDVAPPMLLATARAAISAVPEPADYLMLLVGLVVLGVRVRNRSILELYKSHGKG